MFPSSGDHFYSLEQEGKEQILQFYFYRWHCTADYWRDYENIIVKERIPSRLRVWWWRILPVA